MPGTFTCKDPEKQKVSEWTANEILWLSKALWSDQVVNNSKKDNGVLRCYSTSHHNKSRGEHMWI